MPHPPQDHAHPSPEERPYIGHEEVLDAVGPRLKALRHQRGTTLADLSEATGISVSTLSRLESGQRRATLELLLPLARIYHVALDDLVGAPDTGDPRVRLRGTERGGMSVIPLSRRPGALPAYKLVLPPGTPEGAPRQQVHEGYDWLYVLSGRLRLLLGPHEVLLTAGEVAEFDTRTPHWFGNPGPGTSEVVAIMGPQGERLHVRTRASRR